MLAGTDDHLTWPSPVILNLESMGSTHLESKIRVLSDVFGCEPLFYFMDKVSTQESTRVLKNSESTYNTSLICIG